MSENKINIWEDAAKPGLVLGLVSILYMFVTMFTSRLAGTGAAAFLIGTLNFLLWAAKLFLCIYLMRAFMLAFSGNRPSADNRAVMRFGMVVALYSALLYSAFYLVYVLYINPESISSSFELVMQQYAGMMDSDSLATLQNMESDMPAIGFFTNLVWCWLFGTVLSAIFSRNIPVSSSDPFKDDK